MTLVVFIYGLSQAIIVNNDVSQPVDITPTAILGSFILFISVLLFIYSVLLGLQALIILTTTEFAVTNRRVVAKLVLYADIRSKCFYQK